LEKRHVKTTKFSAIYKQNVDIPSPYLCYKKGGPVCAECYICLLSSYQTMKLPLFPLSLLALAAAGHKIRTRDLQYGFCEGASQPFSIDEFVLEPYPVVLHTGAPLHVVLGITLFEPIPVGSTATLKVIKDGFLDIPIPCILFGDIHIGSW
jgi:hypothetical protein